MPSQYISALDAARLAGSSINYILRHIKSKRLPAIQVPSPTRLAWRIKRKDFDYFMADYIPPKKPLGASMNRAADRKPTLNNGYMYVYSPEHQRANFHGYIPEHVVVAEEKLGRSLKKKEQVHHVNGIKTDNRPENLEVFENLSEHLKKGHGKALKARGILMHMLAKTNYDPSLFTVEQKAALWDELVENLKN